MTTAKHKITAITLAFLVLISTTGIGLNIMLCHCTGQQYLALLASKLNLECCKDKLAESAKKSCCSKATFKQAKNNFESPTIMAEDGCCSSSFKYAKANINLELTEDVKLPTTNFVLAYSPTNTILSYQEPLLIYPVIARSNLSNKAPPRFKESILNWFQTYRC